MKNYFKNIITQLLIWEARLVLWKYAPKVVVVTGSVGKTSTKDAVYAALSQVAYTRKSEKSFNSEIGVPLSILGLPNAWSSISGWLENLGEGMLLLLSKKKYPEWLVLEVGVDRPGDIQRLLWLRTNIVIFTHFPDVPVHVEYFKTPEMVMTEKRVLKTTLQKGGVLVCNADDPNMINEVVEEGQHLLTYGFSDNALVRGSDYSILYEQNRPKGISFQVHFQDKSLRCEHKGVLGQHHAYPLLASLAAMVAEGKLFEQAIDGLRNYDPAPGRMRVLSGKKNTTLIDDTYNSSPAAVHAGLDALHTISAQGKKIVVLGDMLELGDYSVKEHQRVGEKVADVADVFIAFGVRMNDAVDVVREKKGTCTHIESFQQREDAVRLLEEIMTEGDVVFIKGSQGMRMERITVELLADKNDVIHLPRQDEHWKSIS